MIKTGLFWSGVVFVLMVVVSAIGWQILPEGEMIARHWNIQGEPDGYSSKWEILIGMPAMLLFLSLIMAGLPKIFPRRENLEASSGMYLVGWVGTAFLLLGVHGFIIHTAVNGAEEISPDLIIAGVGLFLAVLGNFMAKSRSNWLVGLRNPWTLSSEHAWGLSNRICGYLFVLTGLIVAVVAFVSGMQTALYVLLGGSIGGAILGTIISYFAWANDPDRKVETTK